MVELVDFNETGAFGLSLDLCFGSFRFLDGAHSENDFARVETDEEFGCFSSKANVVHRLR